MKKVLFLILLLLFSSLNLPENTYAQNQCQGVTIDRKTITDIERKGLTDYRVYPIDQEITIHIPTSQDNFPNLAANEFGLFSYYQSATGWIKEPGKGILKASEAEGEVSFIIKRDTVMDVSGKGLRLLIPNPYYYLVTSKIGVVSSWEMQDLNFDVVNAFKLQEVPNLNKVCKFALRTVNQCSEYEGFIFSQGTEDFEMGFSPSSLVPSGSKDKFGFALRRGPSFEPAGTQPIGSNSDPTFKIFGLKRSEAAGFFRQALPLELRYYESPSKNSYVCEMPYIPVDPQLNEQLQSCQVSSINESDGSFRGRVLIENVPTRILSVNQDEYINAGITNYGIGVSTIANPKLVVIPRNIYDNLITARGTAVPGIVSIGSNDYFSFCDTSNNITCFSLDHQSPTQEKTLITLSEDASYMAIIVYSVNEIFSNPPAPSVTNSAYYLLTPCSFPFQYENGGITPQPTVTPLPTFQPGIPPTPTPLPRSAICNSIKNQEEHDKCIRCIGADEDNSSSIGVWTGIGCIETGINQFISRFFSIGLGLAGGIALLFFIYGGFLVLTSQGNAEQVQQGREIITSAIAGLLLIIFSVFILKLISVDILKLPGFENKTAQEETPTQTPTPTSIGIPLPDEGCPADKPRKCSNICCPNEYTCGPNYSCLAPTPTSIPTPTPVLPDQYSLGINLRFDTSTSPPRSNNIPFLDPDKGDYYIMNVENAPAETEWSTLVFTSDLHYTNTTASIVGCYTVPANHQVKIRAPNISLGLPITLYAAVTYPTKGCLDIVGKTKNEVVGQTISTQYMIDARVGN